MSSVTTPWPWPVFWRMHPFTGLYIMIFCHGTGQSTCQEGKQKMRERVFVCMRVVGCLFDGGLVGPYKNQPRSNNQLSAKQPPTTINQQWTNPMSEQPTCQTHTSKNKHQPRIRHNRLPTMQVCGLVVRVADWVPRCR